jgi:hypothetical protein
MKQELSCALTAYAVRNKEKEQYGDRPTSMKQSPDDKLLQGSISKTAAMNCFFFLSEITPGCRGNDADCNSSYESD